ncbi:MAG: hypothetical protein F7C35_08540 [Desulfurococcales archaeon]|nr:hypothetical protein [Desulfurococcales archaeon]
MLPVILFASLVVGYIVGGRIRPRQTGDLVVLVTYALILVVGISAGGAVEGASVGGLLLTPLLFALTSIAFSVGGGCIVWMLLNRRCQR